MNLNWSLQVRAHLSTSGIAMQQIQLLKSFILIKY